MKIKEVLPLNHSEEEEGQTVYFDVRGWRGHGGTLKPKTYLVACSQNGQILPGGYILEITPKGLRLLMAQGVLPNAPGTSKVKILKN